MAQETSTLVVAVDSTGVLKATAELDRLTAASARAEAATGKLGGTNAAASTGMGKAAEAATKLSASENAAAAKTAEVAAASTAATKALDAQAAAQVKAAQQPMRRRPRRLARWAGHWGARSRATRAR